MRFTGTAEGNGLDVAIFAHKSRAEWALSLTPTSPFVAIGAGPFAIIESQGNYNITDAPQNTTTRQSIDQVDRAPGSLTICGSLGSDRTAAIGRYNLTLRANNLTRRGLDFALTATSTLPNYNRLYLRWAADAAEQFYGMGEQYTIHGLRGRTVPIFTSEQGVGRGAQPVSDFMNSMSTFHNAAGDWHTTYSAVGHYLTSELRSVALRGAGYTWLDFATGDHGHSGATTVVARVAAARKVVAAQNAKGAVGSLEGTILTGDSPDEIVEGYTRIFGRMAPLPSWVGAGAVVGYEGGTQAVREVWARLQAAEVPLAAFLLQDWSGVRRDAFGKRLWWNWEVDPEWYPGWRALEADLRAAGSRLTSYINPYLSNSIGSVKKNFTRNLWAEAAAKGFLVANASGLPYIQASGSDGFTFSTLDLTNPAARSWTKRLIRCNLLGDQRGCDGNATASAPQSGYMSDFGEYIPFDSRLWSGEPAAVVHNKYPALWSQVCREAQREAGRDGDVVFWSRSVSPASPQWATAFWAGDQLTTWDSYDGLSSALKAMLSGRAVHESLAEPPFPLPSASLPHYRVRRLAAGLAQRKWPQSDLQTFNSPRLLPTSYSFSPPAYHRSAHLSTPTGGLSGLAISHSDLGGYTMVEGYALRSKVLL